MRLTRSGRKRRNPRFSGFKPKSENYGLLKAALNVWIAKQDGPITLHPWKQKDLRT